MDRRAIDASLKVWGRWLWLYGMSDGCYARESAITSCYHRVSRESGRVTARVTPTRSSGGHRILSEFGRVMPPWLFRVHLAVCALPPAQHVAVLGRYASGLMDGKELSDEQVAFGLQITLTALHERLRRARAKLANILR